MDTALIPANRVGDLYILVFFALTEQPPPSVQRESSADRNWSLSEGLLTGTSALIGDIYSWTHC
jgi:hypothetical protein